MELGRIEIVLMHGRTELINVFGRGYCRVVDRYVVAVDIVHVFIFHVGCYDSGMRDMKRVPPHVRHLQSRHCGVESQHIGIKYSEAVDIALHGVTAHQLLADANSEHRLM